MHEAAKKGTFEIVDGQRRFLACRALQKKGKLPKTFSMRCEVRAATDAQEISLTANVVRLAMHPADEFEAFNALVMTGLPISAIATRFGVTEKKVEQRLRLANAAPEIFDEYRQGNMNLSVLEAYCVTENIERQLSVFQAFGSICSEYQVRARLTQELVTEDDPRVKLVTLSAYIGAGGTIVSDLFQENQYISDIELLDKLAAVEVDKLKAVHLKDGWAWVEFCWNRSDIEWNKFHRVEAETVDLSTADEATVKKFQAELDPLVNRDDLTGDEWELVDRLRDSIDEIEDRRLAFSVEQKSNLGVRLQPTWQGDVEATFGLAETKQEKPSDSTAEKPAYSKVHLDRLASEHTLVLQAFLADSPNSAMVLLIAELAECHFRRNSSRLFSGVRSARVVLSLDDDALENNKANIVLRELEASWAKRFEGQDKDFIRVVFELNDDQQESLLAFLLAKRLDATTHHDAPNRAHINKVSSHLGGDISEYWKPTAEGHFKHVSKGQLNKNVVEAVGTDAGSKLQGMSKKDMAAVAERLTHNSGWIPEIMRAGVEKTPSIPKLQAAE